MLHLMCQQVKADHQKPVGTLQPLPIPKWKWKHITMDFVVSLPHTQIGYDAIWMIVDRLIKSTYFLAIRGTFSLKRLARLYINEIVKLHEVPVSIMSDRDLWFTSQFQLELQKTLGTTLHFSTAFHLQTDGQFEKTIQTLKDMLQAYVLDFKDNWVIHLSLVEFAYNNNNYY